jgi:hypothetical protein
MNATTQTAAKAAVKELRTTPVAVGVSVTPNAYHFDG